MKTYQKFLNDGILTGMEKYSVIKGSGRKLLMRRQCDDSTILLVSKHSLNEDIWSLSVVFSTFCL